MSSIGTKLKREAAVQGYTLWFKSISGQDINVSRTGDSADIAFQKGQAKAIENYFGAMIPGNLFYLSAKNEKATEKKEGDSLNVNVPWGKIFIPLALKTVLPPLALYSIALLYITRKF